eukprot:TRINITY_DN16871_c0_g1_i1.p1 TRINITY_DN16871_c0_g1~~TRINITY_DN16871_c0_g1_i1.p1  ORF type:complete len:472 (+),score=79.99 TRINITY_DN16871_c0_g1_i1:194-1417(+)
MSWLKGTEWQWNRDRFTIKLQGNGDMDAPFNECNGGCKWTAEKDGTLFLGVGEHIFRCDAGESKPRNMKGMNMRCRGPGQTATLTFRQIFDHDAATLDKDLYEIFGLPEDASDAEIKKVYRKLSIKYHPDKNPDEASRAIFNDVRDAYEILNDPDKKILYDTGGMQAVKDAEKGQVETTQDFNSEIEVNLEDLYLGKQFTAHIQRGVVCRGCRKNPNRQACKGCNKCPNQVKTVNVQMGPFMTQQRQEVPSKEKCKNSNEPLEVHIEKGMAFGDTLTFPRMASERPGMMPGSVHLKLKMKKHGTFVRNNNDLHMDVKISLKEALLGWSRKFRHMDGHEFEVKSDGGVTKYHQVYKVKGEGMPLRDDPSSFGALHAKVTVDFPKKLTSQQRNLIAEIFKDESPRNYEL